MLNLARRFPLRFAMAYGGAKTIAADALVQRHLQGNEVLDSRRLALFGAFGIVQVGWVQYQLYVNAFGRMFPGAASFAAAPLRTKMCDAQGLRSLAAQIWIDQAVYHPLMCTPLYSHATRERAPN